jgi:hypothetical protein
MPMSQMDGVGFGQASLWGTWKTDRIPADAIEVCTLAARQGDSVALIAVADFMELWPTSCRRIRRKLSAELGIAEEAIGVFATQNHGVDGDGPPGVDDDGIDRAFLAAARQALAAVQPAEVAMLATSPSPPLNVCRRIHFGEFGAFTFYFGYRVDEQGRADVSHILKNALARLVDGEHFYPIRTHNVAGQGESDFLVPEGPMPVPSPLYLPPPTDGLLQGLFFRAAAGPSKGAPIGSLLRFPTHPNTANRSDVNWSSGDYPVHARRRLEQAFGGSALFLTGPCGDSCPLLGRKGLEVAQKIGTQIADAALAALAKLDPAAWQPAAPVRAFAQEVELRIREDYPASIEEAKATCARIEGEVRAILARGKGRPYSRETLVEIKRLQDKWELPLYVGQGSIKQWTGLDLTGQAGQILKHPLYVARIGPATIAGLPGEPFGGISARLRKETLGDGLIVCEAGNGYLSYIPTAAEYPLGGYGPNACLFDASAEDRLVRAIRQAVGKL